MTLTRFFETLDSLHHYSLQLGHSIPVQCDHCLSTDHWVSHGFVHKKAQGGTTLAVGKRVLCSNRGHHQGCGRTARLYLAERMPGFHYSVMAVFAFMQALLTTTVPEAYFQATGCRSSRNAYRWMHKLMANIFRHRKHSKTSTQAAISTRSRRILLINETYTGLSGVFGCGAGYQYQTQRAFFVD